MEPHTEDFKRVTSKKIAVLGVSVANAHIDKGMEDTPSRFREGGLFKAISDLGWEIQDLGDVSRANIESWVREDDEKSDQSKNNNIKIINADIISAMNKRICEKVS